MRARFLFFTWMRIRLFHCNGDPDPDPASHQSDANLLPMVFRPSTASFWNSTSSLQALTALHSSIRDHSEHLKLLNINFNAGPDPAFYSNAYPDPPSKNNADPQPCGSKSASQVSHNLWLKCSAMCQCLWLIATFYKSHCRWIDSHCCWNVPHCPQSKIFSAFIALSMPQRLYIDWRLLSIPLSTAIQANSFYCG